MKAAYVLKREKRTQIKIQTIQSRTPSMHIASPFKLKSHYSAAGPCSSILAKWDAGWKITLVPQLIQIAAEIWYLKMTKGVYIDIAAHPPRRASTRWSVAPPSRLYSEAVLSSALNKLLAGVSF